MKGFVSEFKAFAMKGNVVDLAVAVVIGTAFGKIVSSLVTNIITPVIGLLMGGIDFSKMSYMAYDSEITYGVFIQSIIDFLIISLVIFLVIRLMTKAKLALAGEEVIEPEKMTEPPEEIKLLREIRDSLLR